MLGFECRNVAYMLLCPLRAVLKLPVLESHPLLIPEGDLSEQEKSTKTGGRAYRHDFWGPCALVTLYGFLLWLSSGRDVSWVYVVWCGASILLHLICRPWCFASTFSLHFAVIGYSLAPTLLIASVLILPLRPLRWAAFLLEGTSVCLAVHAALCSYHHICRFSAMERTRAPLLLVPVALAHLYFMSLLPLDVL